MSAAFLLKQIRLNGRFNKGGDIDECFVKKSRVSACNRF